MSSKDELKERLFLDHALQQQPELLQQLLDDPVAVLTHLGVDAETLKCTDDAHKAFARGENFAQAAKALGDIEPVDALPKLAELARQHFGQDFVVTRVPFGLRFSERLRITAGGGGDLTGCGTITFAGLDGDGDIDE